ncbi:MAG: hypothetical protein R2742_03915 [Micropruina glycogenica]
MALFVVPLMLWLRQLLRVTSAALVAALAYLGVHGPGPWQVRSVDAPPQRMMLAWFASYLLRVGAGRRCCSPRRPTFERLAGMDRTAVAITTIAVVVGLAAAEIRVFSKLRIPVRPARRHASVSPFRLAADER